MKTLVTLLMLVGVAAQAETIRINIPDSKVAELAGNLEEVRGQAPSNADTDVKKIRYYIRQFLKDNNHRGKIEKATKQARRQPQTDIFSE